MVSVNVNTLRAFNKAVTGWKSLTRTKCDIVSLEGLKLSIPSKAVQATKISGVHKNGLTTDIFIFKDKDGINLGSHTLYSDGRSRVIDISKDNETFGFLFTSHLGRPQNTTVRNRLFNNGNLLEETNLFSQVYKPNNKAHICNTRVKEVFNVDGTKQFEQEIKEIVPNKSHKILKLNSTMAKDGEMSLNTVTQQGVNIDTNNPFFQTLLLERHDMLRGNYARIAKEKGYKGIEPPLIFSDEPNTVFTGLYKDVSGIAAEDGSYIAIGMSSKKSRSGLINTLAHECEHQFVQHPSIHLSGIRDMRSNNPLSQKFYDGVERRFPKIKQNTEEYKLAENYADDVLNYDNKITKELPDGTKIIDNDLHHGLLIEKQAIKTGELEQKLFNEFVYSFEDEFSLFNTEWLWQH